MWILVVGADVNLEAAQSIETEFTVSAPPVFGRCVSRYAPFPIINPSGAVLTSGTPPNPQ